MLFKNIFLFSILFLAMLEVLHAESFIKEKGEFVASLDYLAYKTDHFWNRKGKRLPTYNDFRAQTEAANLKYGLTSRDTLIGWAAYSCIDESMNGKTIGFQDVEIGWRHAFSCWKAFEISSQVLLLIPVGKAKDSLRYGRFGSEFDLHAIQYFQFNQHPGWVESLVGYRLYSGFPSDQIRANIRIGYDLLSWLQASGGLHLDYGVFNGTKPFSGPSILLEPNYRLLKVECESLVQITSMFYLRGGYFHHIWGENVGTGSGWYGGLLLDF
jgi:hypothetical protein